MSKNTQSIYIEHMGSCFARTLDARKFERYFSSNGFKISKNAKKANRILFITCAYKKNIEDLAVKRIEMFSKYKGRLIIGGCLKEINEERLNRIFKGESFGTQDNEYIDKLFSNFKVKFKDLPDANIIYPDKISQKFKRVFSSRFNIQLSMGILKRIGMYIREKTTLAKTYHIRICQGCVDSHCSYCAIWRAVGPLRSKSIKTCLEEFHNALIRGYKRIILVGDNIGAYGLDINQTLPDLLNEFVIVNKDFELQLDYFNPMWILKYNRQLISIFKSGKIKAVNCPIQSGNNRILNLMNRSHDIHQLKETLSELKRVHPPLKFYTHIIVGFPSEREEEFEDTLNIVKEIGFGSVQIFPFSNISNTPAEGILPKISEQVIKERLEKAARFFHKYGIIYLVD